MVGGEEGVCVSVCGSRGVPCSFNTEVSLF